MEQEYNLSKEATIIGAKGEAEFYAMLHSVQNRKFYFVPKVNRDTNGKMEVTPAGTNDIMNALLNLIDAHENGADAIEASITISEKMDTIGNMFNGRDSIVTRNILQMRESGENENDNGQVQIHERLRNVIDVKNDRRTTEKGNLFIQNNALAKSKFVASYVNYGERGCLFYILHTDVYNGILERKDFRVLDAVVKGRKGKLFSVDQLTRNPDYGLKVVQKYRFTLTVNGRGAWFNQYFINDKPVGSIVSDTQLYGLMDHWISQTVTRPEWINEIRSYVVLGGAEQEAEAKRRAGKFLKDRWTEREMDKIMIAM